MKQTDESQSEGERGEEGKRLTKDLMCKLEPSTWICALVGSLSMAKTSSPTSSEESRIARGCTRLLVPCNHKPKEHSGAEPNSKVDF